MAHVQSKPLIRIHMERRRAGWMYIIMDANAIEATRGVGYRMESDCAHAARRAFVTSYPGERIHTHQLDVCADVRGAFASIVI